MNNKKTGAAVALMVALTGCTAQYSEVPVARNFPTSDQYKLQAAAHWDVVAADITEKLKQDMTGKVRPGDSLYVSSSSATPFNHAVEMELISALTRAGYTVLKSPAGAVGVSVDTRVVKFSPKRLQARMIGVPSALVAGVWALAEADASITAAGVVTAGVFGAEIADWMSAARASGATPQTEIMVSVSVTDASQYLALSKNTYYVTDSDTALYQAVQTRTFAVKGEN